MKDEYEILKMRVDKAWKERGKCLDAIKKTTGQKSELMRKKFQLYDSKYWLLRDKLDYYDSTLVAEDSEIAIKKFSEDIENRYGIFLKSKKIKIGGIDYEGYHKSLITGDVGYYINDEYRGSNYAYRALLLLSSYLYDNKIKDFYISVFHDNKASTKIIEKYGGNIIYQDNLLTCYQCETKKIIKNEKPHSL